MLSVATWTASSSVNLESIERRLMWAWASMLTLKWVYWGWGPSQYLRICPRGHFWGAPTRVPLCRMLRIGKSSSPWSMTSLIVSLFPSALLPWVNLPVTEQASSLQSGNQISVCLPKETIASLTLRVFSKPDSARNTKSSVGPNRHLQNAFQTRQG